MLAVTSALEPDTAMLYCDLNLSPAIGVDMEPANHANTNQSTVWLRKTIQESTGH